MRNRGFSVIELVIILVGLAILLAIAIPNFLKFGAKSKESEAKTNLSCIATAEISYHAEYDKWGLTFENIGWAPMGLTRYKYTLEARGGKELGATGGAPGEWPCTNATRKCVENCRMGKKGAPPAGVDLEKGFTAVAEGNIDNEDEHNDCWWIDQQKMPNRSVNDQN